MDFSTASPYLLSLLLACCLGSPLSYVATRLPQKLAQQWRAEAWATLGVDKTAATGMRPSTNEQAISGRVVSSGTKVGSDVESSPQTDRRCYQKQLLGLASGLLAMASLALYGASMEGLLIFGACIALLLLAVIDVRTYLLPDVITLPLMWAGFGYHLLIQPEELSGAVIGAMAGYLMLWSLYWIFKLGTGRDTIGFGDFKLLAAICAWVGVGMLPLILVVSAGAGVVVGLLVTQLVPGWKQRALPFGPFLAIAGWICLLAGDPLLTRFPTLML